MIKKIARGVLLSVLILGISCIAVAQVKEPISNYKVISSSMKAMEGALEKGLDDASISSAYVPEFGSIFICETVFKEDLGKLEKKAIQLVRALGPLIEVEDGKNICVIIKYGGFLRESQEYIIIAPKMNISEPDKWKIFSSEIKVAFSTPKNVVKVLIESIASEDKGFANQCFSNKVSGPGVVEDFQEMLKGKNLITQVKELTYSTTKLDEETCLVWIFPLGNNEKNFSCKVIKEKGGWHVLSYCSYPLSSEIEWSLEDLEKWKDKGYKLQNFKLTNELNSKGTYLISIFTPFSEIPDWPGSGGGTFGPWDRYSQNLNNVLVIYKMEGEDARKLSQCELSSQACKIDLKLMDINNNGSKEIVVQSAWCGASACSYEIKIFDFRNNQLVQIKIPDEYSYGLNYELIDINKDGVYELLSAGFYYEWNCHANTVYSSLVWSLEKDQYKKDSQSFPTFYQEEIKEIKTRITEELTKSEEEFDAGDYFRDVISLYVNYAYIKQDEKGYQEIKEWISEPKFVSTWDKYYKNRLGLCEDIIEDVKLEMNKWKIEEKIEKKTEKEISYFLSPENTIKTYYEAVYVKQDASLGKRCFSQKTSSLMIEMETSKFIEMMKLHSEIEEEYGQVSPPEDWPQKLSTAKYKTEYINSETCIVEVTFKEELMPTGELTDKWKVIKEHGEWKILMVAGLSKEDEKLCLKSAVEEVQPFFDLSAPENTAKSFMEAIVLKDNEKAAECWSKELPGFLVALTVSTMEESFEEAIQKDPKLKPMLQNPEMLKFFVETFNYKKEKIDENTYYVWWISSDGNECDDPYRVIKEDGKWKIRTLKSLEDNPIFGIQEKE